MEICKNHEIPGSDDHLLSKASLYALIDEDFPLSDALCGQTGTSRSHRQRNAASAEPARHVQTPLLRRVVVRRPITVVGR